MRTILVLIVTLIAGCSEIHCKCGHPNCGTECRNKCEETRCIPGSPCCDKCDCHKKPSLKLK